MILYIRGDILKSEAEAIVNPVNCEGIMGKGLAYQVRKMYPKTYHEYKVACKEGRLKIGKMHWTRENNKIIINFPTKNKWREKSRIGYIVEGLESLIYVVRELNITSIAIPPLGCGLGGLNWNQVRKILTDNLEQISDDVTIYIYQPLE